VSTDFGVGPTVWGGGEIHRGDGEGLLVHGEKNEGDMEAAGKVF
jgi:hypothetical protein